MPVIRLAGTKKILFRIPPLLMAEFIPLVKFDRPKFDTRYGFLASDSDEATLSNYLDDGLRKHTPVVLDTEQRNLKIPFVITKGCEKSQDNDGVIDVRLSVTDPEIQLKGSSSFNANYTSCLELEIEIKKNTDIEFYIDFFASDDTEDELVEGDLKDIHCGRMKIDFKFRSVIVIIVGSDSQDEHKHKSEDNFVIRVNRLVNTQTIENLALTPHEFVYVIVPKSMSAANIAKLRSYGNGLSHYEIHQKNAAEIPAFLNSLKNIRSLTYFGHGIDAGPLYEYGVSRLPEPNSFNRSSFAPDAIASFMTCNSKQYAERFASTLGVNSIGVEGTTFYGTEEISAGRLTETSASGTSFAWQYKVSPAGISSKSYSLSQVSGTPFLRKR